MNAKTVIDCAKTICGYISSTCSADESIDIKPIKILLVDDCNSTLHFISRYIKKARPYFQVKATTSPERALNLIKEGHWDAIVSDHYMPSIKGLDLLKIISEEYPANCDVKILFSSIILSSEKVLAFKSMGIIDAFVEKPDGVAMILSEIDSVLTRKRLLNA